MGKGCMRKVLGRKLRSGAPKETSSSVLTPSNFISGSHPKGCEVVIVQVVVMVVQDGGWWWWLDGVEKGTYPFWWPDVDRKRPRSQGEPSSTQKDQR